MSRFADDGDAAGSSPYALTTAREIQAVLRAIAQQKALLQVTVPPGVSSVVTRLLQADEHGFLFERPGEALTLRVLGAERIVFETVLDQVRIQFAVPRAEQVEHDVYTALWAPLPEQLMRVQRRETFRIKTPLVRPPLCRVKSDSVEVALALDNISGGGVGLFDDDGVLTWGVGQVFQHCQFVLPGVGTVSVGLQVVQLSELRLPSGRLRTRLGCAYVAPAGGALLQIQRYVGLLEREAMARRRGLV